MDDHFDERAELDLKYIDQWSLWMDLRILARTSPGRSPRPRPLTRHGREARAERGPLPVCGVRGRRWVSPGAERSGDPAADYCWSLAGTREQPRGRRDYGQDLKCRGAWTWARPSGWGFALSSWEPSASSLSTSTATPTGLRTSPFSKTLSHCSPPSDPDRVRQFATLWRLKASSTSSHGMTPGSCEPAALTWSSPLLSSSTSLMFAGPTRRLSSAGSRRGGPRPTRSTFRSHGRAIEWNGHWALPDGYGAGWTRPEPYQP